MFQGEASFGSVEEGHRIVLHVNIRAVDCTEAGNGCSTSVLKIKEEIVHRGVPHHVLVVLLRLQV